jgi:hypothetical protein
MFAVPSKKQQADDLAKLVAEFKAQGNTAVQCLPAMAQGADTSKRQKMLLAEKRAALRKAAR